MDLAGGELAKIGTCINLAGSKGRNGRLKAEGCRSPPFRILKLLNFTFQDFGGKNERERVFLIHKRTACPGE